MTTRFDNWVRHYWPRGYPHWAQVAPVRIVLLIVPTWAMLDGLFCLGVTGMKKAIRVAATRS